MSVQPVGPKRRILFVDDEVSALESLRSLLRRQRRTWDLVFTPGADEALAALDGAAFDVVVSDMQMSGTDGATLLREVQRRQPGCARIVLSGHSDPRARQRALPVAHQFLSKPCDAEQLRMIIDRTCNLQALLADDTIRHTIGRLDRLPSVPQTYLALTEALEDPTCGLADLAEIVEQDPAMSAKVLQLVNSAFFGLPRQLSSIRQAVMYLGAAQLKGLALTAGVFAAAGNFELEDFSLQDLQRTSIRTARLARRFLLDAERAEAAFTAGIVHDLGQLVLALGLPSAYAGVHRAAAAIGQPVHHVEAEVFGTSHAEIGAYLLGVWGLPFSIVEAVAHHHRPAQVVEGPRDVLAAVHIADILVDRSEADDPAAAARLPDIDVDFLEHAGCIEDLPRWKAIAELELGQPGQER
jgi:HD-like signal output (HDOD) protein